jgi:hypothetical protein
MISMESRASVDEKSLINQFYGWLESPCAVQQSLADYCRCLKQASKEYNIRT